jgi:hypothetical protein
VASTLVALPHVEDFAQFEAFNTAVNIATEDLSTDDDGDEGTLAPHSPAVCQLSQQQQLTTSFFKPSNSVETVHQIAQVYACLVCVVSHTHLRC